MHTGFYCPTSSQWAHKGLDCRITSIGTVCTQRLGLLHYIIWHSVHTEAQTVAVCTRRPGSLNHVIQRIVHTDAWIFPVHYLAQCAYRSSDCRSTSIGTLFAQRLELSHHTNWHIVHTESRTVALRHPAQCEHKSLGLLHHVN